MSRSNSSASITVDSKLKADPEDQTAQSERFAGSVSPSLGSAEKPAVAEESEITIKSSLQILGGFILLFNS